MKAVMHFVCALLAMYIAEVCPALSAEIAEAVPNLHLEDLQKKALEKDYGVHVYKLIHICCNICKEDEYICMDGCLRTANVALSHLITKAVQ